MKVGYGEMLRKGYGVAWQNYTSHTLTCYPVPFNLIARWLRELWFILTRPPKRRYQEAYNEGYREGKEAGESYGVRKGKLEALREYKKDLGNSLLEVFITKPK